MVPVHPQYIIDENKERTGVILSVEDWERIVEELEELDDIPAYDEAKSSYQERIPLEQAVREIQSRDLLKRRA